MSPKHSHNPTLTDGNKCSVLRGLRSVLQHMACVSPCQSVETPPSPLPTGLSGKFGPHSGSSNCAGCPIGSYASSAGQTSCDTCALGGYCDEVDQDTCGGGWTPCQPGTYSATLGATGSEVCTPCAVGKHSLYEGMIDKSACTVCARGSASRSPGRATCDLCSGGTYQPELGTSRCLTCMEGRFCPEGATTPLPCEAGSWTNSTDLSSQEQCQLCPPHHACGTGAVQPVPCKEGSHAPHPGSAVCTNCPPGSYQDVPGSGVHTFWQLTPNDSEGGLNRSGESASGAGSGSGSFQEDTSNAFPSTDGSGEFESGSGDITLVALTPPAPPPAPPTQCKQCPGGHACAEGSATPRVCGPGSFAIPGSEGCSPCNGGTYQSSPNATSCQSCEPGSICPTGASAPLPCKKGSFSSATDLADQSECSPCPPGSACSTGSVTPTPCTPGSISSDFSSPECTPCNGGTYQSSPNATSCQSCEPGSICPARLLRCHARRQLQQRHRPCRSVGVLPMPSRQRLLHGLCHTDTVHTWLHQL